MGGLPRFIRKLPERSPNPIVEVRTRSLHAVPASSRISTRQTIPGGNVEQKREIGYQSTSRQRVGGTNLGFGEPAPCYLIRVSREKETIQQHERALFKRGPYFTRDELRARG